MPTQTLNQDWQAGNESLARQISVTADAEANVEVAVADASTDLQVNLAIDVSALKLLYMVCDQEVTVETNDAATPDDTFTLKAGKPLVWNEDSYFSNPLTVDVTELYVTNNSGAAAILIVKTLQDATP